MDESYLARLALDNNNGALLDITSLHREGKGGIGASGLKNILVRHLQKIAS